MPSKSPAATATRASAASKAPTPTARGPVFQPVRTRRAFEVVCDQIRQQIARGDLRPGERLPGEKELAEQFDISRIAVREALRSLEAAAVVEARTGLNGGFFIRDSNSAGLTQSVQDMVSLGQVSISDVTEARVELMGVAIRLACARATEEELNAIEADIDHHTELFRERGGSRNTKSVIEFYRLIARATHNNVILMMVDALSEIIRELLAHIDPQPRQDIMLVRRQVLALLRARDPEGASAAMALHLRKVSEYLESESQKKTAAKATATAKATAKAKARA
ncbi:FadR/GntR family transcriptional regulator [Hydrogenophaga sp.]|uniref:FadR/GntR family transcriptional regulator n=1 Tax=Hydrogenophaga sp. TaxID=1904254 RepID=UPI00391CD282